MSSPIPISPLQRGASIAGPSGGGRLSPSSQLSSSPLSRSLSMTVPSPAKPTRSISPSKIPSRKPPINKHLSDLHRVMSSIASRPEVSPEMFRDMVDKFKEYANTAEGPPSNRASGQAINLREAYLDPEGFAHALTDLGFNPTLSRRAFEVMDEDGSRSLELNEFLEGASMILCGSLEDKIDFCFKLFDKDNSTLLEIWDIEWMIDQIHGQDSYSDDAFGKLRRKIDVDNMMRCLDSSYSGRITKDDFRERLLSNRTTMRTILESVFLRQRVKGELG